MIRLVTEEMPTSATKIRALKLSAGSPLSPLLSIALLHPPALGRSGGSVADARDGPYDLGPRRVALDLGPQAADVDVYVAAGEVVRPRGDRLGDLGARERLPRTPHQERQYLELRWCQLQQLPRPTHR